MTRRPFEDAYELTPLQQGILYHCLAASDPTAYAITLAVTLEGALDLAAFREAWRLAARRNAVLRTSLHWDGLEKPVQVVEHEAEPPLAEQDGRGWPEGERGERLASLLRAQHEEPLRLDAAPLYRLSLVRTGERTHRLGWTFHHAVLEGWSASLVLQDVLAAHGALVRGESPALPDRVPFRDFILWLQGRDRAASEAFWRGHLRGYDRPVTLDLPRGRDGTAGGAATERIALDAPTTAALQEHARRRRLTLATVVQGAYALLLSRCTGEENVVFGHVVSGRTIDLPGVESMVGLLVNTLPARVRVPDDLTLACWLEELQSSLREAERFGQESLVEVQGFSGVPRGTPLFESLFAIENWAPGAAGTGREGGPPETPGLRLTEPEILEGTTGYSLAVSVTPGPPIVATFRFDPARFDGAAVRRLADRFRAVLEGLSRGLDGRVGDVSLLRESERRQLLSGWSAGGRRPTLGPSVLDLFDEQVRQAPAAVAVRFRDRQVSYEELDRRARRVATRLRSAGLGPEQGVALCMERSIELVVGILGVLKCGAYYVPLDPSYPSARLAYMLADAGARVVLTDASSRAKLGPTTKTALVLPDAEQGMDDADRPSHRPADGQLAYAIYTSGSSGTPKGVAVEHRGLLNLVSWHCRAYGVGPGDRATLVASPGFDASVWELWPYLCAGATIEIPDEETRAEPARLWTWLAERSITHTFLPTPIAEAVLREPAATPPSLRVLLTGGDRLHRPPSGPLPFTLVNHYGPTESTVVTTAHPVDPADADDPPIGRPIDNLSAYVLDARLRPVAAGLAGELYVGGIGLARGYAGRPDLTAERFVPSPFERGERLYRTGDRARWRGDGTLQFLGRADDQVKVRGFRVEPREIEAALRRQPEVAECLVVAHESHSAGTSLAAYVVPRRGGAGSIDGASLGSALRARLSDTLPAYMVPSAVVFLEALPLAPNGKVDRKALPPPDVAAWPGGDVVPPRTPIEEALVEIWKDVLARERVGIHEDFFALGGHSLLATRVASLVRRTYEVELPLRLLFERPTVAGLAEAVEQARGAGEREAPPPLRPAARGPEPPLSFAQQRLWFLDQMGSGSAYNVPWALRLRGALDIGALRRALDDVVARHETLRTTFPAREGRAVQAIAAEGHVELAELDLRSLPAGEREGEARRVAAEETRRPFDLARGPLLRATLVRLDDEDHVLLVTIHHIVTDGWSMGVLTRELVAHYGARRRGEAASLPPLPVQYADFARWQRDRLRGEELDRQLGYWRERLGGELPRLDLPTDRPRGAVQTFRGGAHAIAFPHALCRGLAAVCREEGATLFMVLLAGFQALLHRYTGQEDVVVGSPIANRNRSEVEGLIGFFVNSLVMRTDLSGDPTFAELVARTREAALGAYDHQDLPFERLVEELHPGRDLARNPLFQIVFAVQNAPWEPPALPGLEVSAFARETTATRFDLEVHVFGRGDGLGAFLTYDAELFEAGTVSRMAGQYVRLLESAVSSPLERVSRLGLMGKGEEEEELRLSRGVRSEYPRESTIGE
ncbi:MAG TPA: amino acid adenylation domain-containing protein, partial [Vicinamibacteria bacterium]|nr:amino acid adenylation domain-containing protein [Vicinamibacteria bacterium]